VPTGNPGSTLNDELNRLANGGTYPPISEYLDRAGAARKWAAADGISLGAVTDLVGVLNLIAGITNRSQWLDLAGVCNFGAGTVGLEAAAALRTVTGGPAGTPSAPINVTTTITETGVLVLWDPPVSEGDSPRISYTLYSYPTATFFPISGIDPGASGITVDSLTVGEYYTFRVSATNSQGEGPLSLATSPPVTYPPVINDWDNYDPTTTWNTVSPTAIWDNQ
jgi:hypothetical protein